MFSLKKMTVLLLLVIASAMALPVRAVEAWDCAIHPETNLYVRTDSKQIKGEYEKYMKKYGEKLSEEQRAEVVKRVKMVLDFIEKVGLEGTQLSAVVKDRESFQKKPSLVFAIKFNKAVTFDEFEKIGTECFGEAFTDNKDEEERVDENTIESDKVICKLVDGGKMMLLCPKSEDGKSEMGVALKAIEEKKAFEFPEGVKEFLPKESFLTLYFVFPEEMRKQMAEQMKKGGTPMMPVNPPKAFVLSVADNKITISLMYSKKDEAVRMLNALQGMKQMGMAMLPPPASVDDPDYVKLIKSVKIEQKETMVSLQVKEDAFVETAVAAASQYLAQQEKANQDAEATEEAAGDNVPEFPAADVEFEQGL